MAGFINSLSSLDRVPGHERTSWLILNMSRDPKRAVMSFLTQ